MMELDVPSAMVGGFIGAIAGVVAFYFVLVWTTTPEDFNAFLCWLIQRRSGIRWEK